ERSDGAGPVSGRLSIALQCLLENIDHDPEHGFKCLPNAGLLPQNFGGKSDQRTAPVDVLEMLKRKIVADELGRAVDSTRIDGHELLLAQNMGDRFRVKITFAVEVTIEAATCEPRIGHDVINRYGIEAMAVEQSSCAADYFMFGQVAVLGRIRHETLHEVRK